MSAVWSLSGPLQLQQIRKDAWDMLDTEAAEENAQSLSCLDEISSDALSALLRLLKANTTEELAAPFWRELVGTSEEDMQLPLHRALIVVLHGLLCRGGNLAVLSAKVYLSLLQVPGSQAYGVFKPTVYHATLGLLRSLTTSLGSTKSNNKRGKTTKNKAPKTAQSDDIDIEDFADSQMSMDGMADEENSTQTNVNDDMSAEVKMEAIYDILRELKSLCQVKGAVADPESINYTCDVLIELTRLAVKVPTPKSVVNRLGDMSEAIYDILNSILSCEGEDKMLFLTQILKGLVPNVLMTHSSVLASTVPKDSLLIRNKALDFLLSLMATNKSTTVAETASSVAASKSSKRKSTGRQKSQSAQANNEQLDANQNQGQQNDVTEKITVFLQHICVHMPDKADYRSYAAEAFKTVFSKLPVTSKARLVQFVCRYAKNKKSNWRLFAVELADLLIHNWDQVGLTLDLDQPVSSENDTTEDVNRRLSDIALFSPSATAQTPNAAAAANSVNRFSRPIPQLDSLRIQKYSGVLCILELLLLRCSDSVPSVRAKALGCLSSVLICLQKHCDLSCLLHYSFVALSPSTVSASAVEETPQDASTPGGLGGSRTRDLASLLRRRCRDEKPVVRKSALVVLETLLSSVLKPSSTSSTSSSSSTTISKQTVTLPDVQSLADLCMDTSLAVRKQAMTSLSSLLMLDLTNPVLQKLWISAVLPAVLDTEVTVQERCFELVLELILEPVCAWGKDLIRMGKKPSQVRSESVQLPPVWGLLDKMEADSIQYLQRIISALSKKSELPSGLAGSLIESIRVAVQSNSSAESIRTVPWGVWVLLEETASVGSAAKQIDIDLMIQCWKTAKQCLQISESAQPESNFESAMRDAETMQETNQFTVEQTPVSKRVSESVQPSNQASTSSKPVKLNGVRIARSVLTVLSKISSLLSSAQSALLAEDLITELSQFNHVPDLIKEMIYTLSVVYKSQQQQSNQTGSSSSQVTDWIKDLLSSCEAFLQQFVFQSETGEIANGLFPLSQTSTALDDSMVSASQTSSSSSQNKTFTAGFDVGMDLACLSPYLFTLGELCMLMKPPMPKRLVTLVQALVTPTLYVPSSSTNGESSSQQNVTLPPAVRAHAFVSLGKMCLVDEPLAKKCISVFIREMETSDSVVIRNNILVILSDLCIRYTSMVDRYIPQISACLRDKSELIRRHTLMILTQLLAEDYIKFKGTLFFRFLFALVDESDTIRDFMQNALSRVLFHKHSTLFCTHFVETVFHLNGYMEHPVYNQMNQSDREKSLFTLHGGGVNARRRQVIYKFMLEQMTDEQKFQITAKLVQDILGGLVDGVIALPGRLDATQTAPATVSAVATEQLVCDALMLLSCKNIRIALNHKKTQDDGDEMVEPTAEQAQQAAVNNAVSAAKGKLLNALVKKNVVENILPVVIELKRQLESAHSSLLKQLMDYLRELMKEYKDELQDVLSTDKQLAQEIEFDLRRHAELYKQRQQQTRVRLSLGTAPLPTAMQSADQSVTPSKPSAGMRSGLHTPLTVSRRSSLATPKSVPRILTQDRRSSVEDGFAVPEPRAAKRQMSPIPYNGGRQLGSMYSPMVNMKSKSNMQQWSIVSPASAPKPNSPDTETKSPPKKKVKTHRKKKEKELTSEPADDSDDEDKEQNDPNFEPTTSGKRNGKVNGRKPAAKKSNKSGGKAVSAKVKSSA